MITFLSSKIADFLYKRKIITYEYIEICKYGYEVLFFNLLNALIVLLLGYVLNKLLYSVVFFFVFATVRQYCGGYHSNSTVFCTALYITIYLIVILLTTCSVTKIYFNIITDIIFCMCYLSAAISFSPIENANKPLSDNEKAKHKKSSIILGILLTLVSAFSYKVNMHISAVISLTLFMVTILMIIAKHIGKEESS